MPLSFAVADTLPAAIVITALIVIHTVFKFNLTFNTFIQSNTIASNPITSGTGIGDDTIGGAALGVHLSIGTFCRHSAAAILYPGAILTDIVLDAVVASAAIRNALGRIGVAVGAGSRGFATAVGPVGIGTVGWRTYITCAANSVAGFSGAYGSARTCSGARFTTLRTRHIHIHIPPLLSYIIYKFIPKLAKTHPPLFF